MRRTASSTASLQHRDTIVAVLNSARLNEEAPHDSRAALSIRPNRRREAAGVVSSGCSFRTGFWVVAILAAAAWPSLIQSHPTRKQLRSTCSSRLSAVIDEESFLLTGLRSSRYSTVQFFRTVLVL